MHASGSRYRIGVQSDPMDFLAWLLNALHTALGGTKAAGSSIIHTTFQGTVEVTTRSAAAAAAFDEAQAAGEAPPPEAAGDTKTVPFLYLTVDVPAAPLFKDALERNIIPQVPLVSCLTKFDGTSFQEMMNGDRRQYVITKLPKYLVVHIKRFSKNTQQFVEKNPTIVNFPVRNLEMGPYARLADGQHRQNVRASGCTYEAMVEVMRADYAHTARPFFFSKELSCYFDSSAFDDAALRDFDHVFLVRDPHATLASFYRVGVKGAATLTTSYYDDREAGFVESLALYRRVRRAGARTLVLDADDELMRDPELTLRRFCTFARVPFDARMLAWERAAPPEWSKFRGWHDDVAMSTRFDATLGGARSKVTVPAAVFAAASRRALGRWA